MLLALLPLLVGLLVVGAAPAPAASRAPALTASPASAIPSETITFTGSVPTTAPRGVRLQEKRGRSWVTVTTGTTDDQGAYTLARKAPATRGSTAYRVVAPRARVAGVVRSQVVSRTRSVARVAQSSTISWSFDDVAGPALTTWTATFAPVREGRVVVFQQLVDGAWVEQDRGAQAADGSLTWQTSYVMPEGVQVRAVTLAANGAAAHATKTVKLPKFTPRP